MKCYWIRLFKPWQPWQQRPRAHVCGYFWKHCFFAFWPPVHMYVCMYVCREATEKWGCGNQIPRWRFFTPVYLYWCGQLKHRFWERRTPLPQFAHGSCCLHVLHLHRGGQPVCLCVPSIARSNSMFTRHYIIIIPWCGGDERCYAP